MAGRSRTNRSPNFFGGYCAEDTFATSLSAKNDVKRFFGFFCCQAAQFVSFHQASVNVVQQHRLTFDLEIEAPRLTTSPLHYDKLRTRSHECGGQRRRAHHVDPCSRAREVTRIVLWFPVKPAQNFISRPLEDDRECCLCSTRQPSNVKYGRHPPHITGRSVSTVHQGWVGARNKFAMCGGHDAVVDLKCVEHTKSGRF